jgi:hypothetical protein
MSKMEIEDGEVSDEEIRYEGERASRERLRPGAGG